MRAVLFVYRTDSGMVTSMTSTRYGEMATIMIKEPTTVMILEKICTRSVERDTLMVSIS